MREDLVLAIDAGGTAVKVALFDGRGEARGQAQADVRTSHLPDGRVERDPDAFWSATARAIRSVVTDLPAGQLRAVACTGFGNGVFTVDAEGAPVAPGTVSVDHRAQPLVDRLGRAGCLSALAELNGCRLWGGQTAAQIAFLAETAPETFARVRWFLSCKDYLRFRLTGAAATDQTDASGGGLMAADGAGYALRLFAALGRPDMAERLPPIRTGSATSGRVSALAARETGLPEGLPVAGGLMDVAACALGSGVNGPERIAMIAGTWAINALEVATPPAREPPILNMVHRDGAARLVAEGSPSSAANLGWYLGRGIGGRMDAAGALARVDEAAVEGRRCHFLPFVHGPTPRRGAFIGLTAGDDEGTMLRAICEGVAFQHRRHAEEILPHGGGRWPEAIRLSGGAARSAVWARIFADICQCPVEVVAADEVGALGAAMCAAVAGGVHPDLTTAQAAMSRVGGRYEPRAEHAEFYAGRYAEFLRLDRGMLELGAALA
ncbi:MAG: carbohydrate kinase [Rhodovulum sulfidophilum]|uniref:Carbohydrate kinase n=1 Tax=Rhodovulum sulfidophilum TaxID=35806 RepID=A0A2W5NIS4_RHOSU|nr:MAG: carbohydrate kinase [Rhodovulum sulfidophilum]